MATTSLWRIRGPVGKVLNYAQNAEKTSCEDTVVPAEAAEGSIDKLLEYAEREDATQRRRFVSGINCNPDSCNSIAVCYE